MHFVFALLTRALHRLSPHLVKLLEAGSRACVKCAAEHNRTQELLQQMVSPPAGAPSECAEVLHAFDYEAIFTRQNEPSSKLKEEVKTRFKRMGDLMTCVGCDRCKLWGTLQFHAARVAFEILLAEGTDGSNNVADQFTVP